jgi:hypothetical protein
MGPPPCEHLLKRASARTLGLLWRGPHYQALLRHLRGSPAEGRAYSYGSVALGSRPHKTHLFRQLLGSTTYQATTYLA